MKVSEIITEHKKGRKAVKYNKKPKPYIDPKKPQAPNKPEQVSEARRKKKKVKRAAYGPGPFGMYGTNVGYSGDGGAVGEDISQTKK